MSTDSTALVLSGGGARAAYQAGVLQGITEVMQSQGLSHCSCCFPIMTGYSAGAFNSTFLASQAHEPSTAVSKLVNLWENISPDQVFKTDLLNLTGNSLKWLFNLTLSGAGGRKANALLNTSPWEHFVKSKIDFEQLTRNLLEGCLQGVAISATNYHTGATVTFFDGKRETTPQETSLYRTVNGRLGPEHVLGSCSIPILFPPTEIEGCYYGDGGIRFSSPLSPALHMGATKILAIGIRHARTVACTEPISRIHRHLPPRLIDIAGVVLNSTFMESLEVDVARARRINELTKKGARKVPILFIQPSVELGQLASVAFRHFPAPLKYLLHGLGASPDRGWDFLSYLAFDKSYTRRLIRLGYTDARDQKEEIISFLKEGVSARQPTIAA